VRSTTFAVLAAVFVFGFAAPARAQEVELSLRPIPDALAPGQGAFVEVEGTFPDTCTFGPEGELTFAVNIVPDDRVDAFYRTADPGPCGDALTFARAVFGPLPFESTGTTDRMEISFTLERGDGLTGFGETAVDVVDEPPVATPEAGFWWNPALSGHGLALDPQGRDVFGAVYSYDESGQPSWRVFQCRIEGGIVVTELLGFAGGNCLLCGEPWMAPGLLEDTLPLHLAFEGPAGAWMRIGPEPGLATGLQRFHLDPAAQSGVDEIPATVPDLAGEWIQIEGSGPSAAVSSAPVRFERLTDREGEGEVVFGLFENGDVAPTHTLSCSQDQTIAYRACGYATEIGDPGPPVLLVPWSGIGANFIEIEGLDTRFIRLPDSD
jgi:hypothetical protein